MSSSFFREPMTGVIRQGNDIVGAITLPEEDIADFILEFNGCYGPLRLKVEPLGIPVPVRPAIASVRPIGAQSPKWTHLSTTIDPNPPPSADA